MGEITIDIKRLRDDLESDNMGAFFGGGFGGALVEAFDIERMSDEKLVETAIQKGIDIRKYQV